MRTVALEVWLRLYQHASSTARSKASISPSTSSLTMHTRRAPPSSCLRAYSALACARHSDHPGRRSTSATSGLELHSAAPCSNEPAATCGVRTLSAVVPGGDCATRFAPMSTRESAAAPKIAAPAAPKARSIQLRLPARSCFAQLDAAARVPSSSKCNRGGRQPTGSKRSQPTGTGVIVIDYGTVQAAPERHAMLLTTIRFDSSVVAKHAILRKHAARALDCRWHRPGVHSAC